MDTEPKIVFQPSGRTVFVLRGTTIFEAAARAGLLLQSPCGGKGTCGKCRVRVPDGACKATEACRRTFTAAQIEEGYRLACQAKVEGDCVVDVPDGSLFESGARILTSAHGEAPIGEPAVWKKYVELPAPTGPDPVADLVRLERMTGKLRVNLEVMRKLPLTLRTNDYAGTAVVCGSRLLAFEAGNTEDVCCAVAFDIGTTTVVGSLLDLVAGREIAVAATLNPQISSGDDVISRITRAREDVGAVAELQATIITALNGLLAELSEQSGIPTSNVYEVSVAGNTTMQHLFCGISPAALGEVPFPPACNRALQLEAREVGLDVHPNGRLHVFPNIGGFVGGDTVAGILANALHGAAEPTIFVDIGTNGEIVLAHDGRLLATSTAAGPAFEGARITAGMRATTGAIEKVVFSDDDILYNVIGNAAPAGICGTALIDLTAELLRLQVLDTTGRMLGRDELNGAVPEKIQARLHEHDGQTDFLLVDAAKARGDEPIYLYQRDIRELQLATGAIRAGVNIMLRKADLSTEDISEVLIAGGFGNFIRRGNARRIGLLPDVPSDRIRFVGNASSMGAKTVLLSAEQRAVSQQIAESTEHVDLSMDPEFQMEFGMAMMFPE